MDPAATKRDLRKTTIVVTGLLILATGIAVFVYMMGSETVSGFLYERALDILENFMRLPERQVI